jgi:hypothetical protein
MCRPRAATSVATRILELGALESGQQALALFLRHVAGQHADPVAAFSSARPTRSTQALVLTNTMVRLASVRDSRPDQQRQLFSLDGK